MVHLLILCPITLKDGVLPVGNLVLISTQIFSENIPVVNIVKKYSGLLPMAVGTGGHREAVERTLEITGLREYFDIIVTANDVDNFKPHPETFLKCAELMKVDPEFIEVFEDGDLGLRAAEMAGMIATDVRSWYDSNW